MSTFARLKRLQSQLIATGVARALLLSLATFFVLAAIIEFMGMSALLPSAVVAVVVGAWTLYGARSAQSLEDVALWAEARNPGLRYALVTVAGGVTSPAIDEYADRAKWWEQLLPAMLRALRYPALFAGAAGGLWLLNPISGFRRDSALTHGGSATAISSIDPLARVRASVTPPAYSGRPGLELDDPTSVEALVGSAISISGSGAAANLAVTADSAARTVLQQGNDWNVSLMMPARPAIVRLHSAAGKDKLIVLAPSIDAAPAVTLLLPARDTIVRKAAGRLSLQAQLRDDIGLHDAAFEIVITSGGGENFTFRTGAVGRVAYARGLEATLETHLPLDSLKLKAGDILQIRAVARDGNNITGPGVGSSETRALRVARPDEYDSVAVEAAPPPEPEAQVLSQRMLINLTEALVKRQSKLARTNLVDESRRIAADQAKLRRKVGDVVFQRLGGEPLAEEGAEEARAGKLTPEDLLKMADSVTSTAGGVMDVEGDETPILAVNKPLLEAFNAMWDAGRSLEVGEPAKALPPMRIALAAIQKARLAERIYLRGGAGKNIVDVSKVRLTGKDKGVASVREARALLDPLVRKRSATFERVTGLLASNPDAAVDSLLLMRVDALVDAPQLAQALDDAARALKQRNQTQIELAWTRVRRALGNAPQRSQGLSGWSVTP